MNRISALLILPVITYFSSLPLAGGAEPTPQPSAQDRLQQVLNTEGGVTVYMDPAGNVQTSATLPNGDQIIRVQPPQIPGLNLGPPLQLNKRPLQLSPPAPTPTQPPAPEFPQKAR